MAKLFVPSGASFQVIAGDWLPPVQPKPENTKSFATLPSARSGLWASKARAGVESVRARSAVVMVRVMLASVGPVRREVVEWLPQGLASSRP